MAVLRIGSVLGFAIMAAVSANLLAGSEWRPLELEGATISTDTSSFVTFEGVGQLVDFDGCNGFFGTTVYTNDEPTVRRLGARQMACEDDGMALERAFLEALDGVRRANRAALEPTLQHETSLTVARIAQVHAD